MTDAADDLQRLLQWMGNRRRVAVAFSGGVDSSTVLAAAERALPGRVRAITAETVAHPSSDRRAAAAILERLGVPQHLLRVDTLALDPVRNNARDRCYHCKRALFGAMQQMARDEQLGELVEGTNADDLRCHRPGLRALAELGVASPLAELGMSKARVRGVARLLGLEVADRPAAACLLTRFPYGVEISAQALERIDRAEGVMRELGVGQVRVRDHGTVARLEVDPAELEHVLGRRLEVARRLRNLGWSHVALDLEGYRSGSYDLENDT